MTYQEYQIAASRTCVSLETNELNARHMFLGVFSELGEMIDIYKKELAYGKSIDTVNLSEEWADVSGYLANEATRLKAILVYKEVALFPYIVIEDAFFGMLHGFLNHQDLERSHNISLESMQFNIIHCFNQWVNVGKSLKIDTNKALENNIAKLKARYPHQFESELALNRNLENERKELSKGL